MKQQTDYRRYNRTIRKSRRCPSWRGNQPYLFTFPYQTNENHAQELSTVGHVISERHWKSTFNFKKTVNSYRLKRETILERKGLEFFIQILYLHLSVCWFGKVKVADKESLTCLDSSFAFANFLVFAVLLYNSLTIIIWH